MYTGKRHNQPPRTSFSGDRLQPSMAHLSPAMPMFAQSSPAYGSFAGQHAAVFNSNAQYAYGSQPSVAAPHGPGFAQVGVPYMNYPYGSMASTMVTVPMHMVQPQFMYGSTPQLHTLQHHPGFYVMQSPAVYTGSPAEYKNLLSMKMAGSSTGPQSFASVPDLTSIGNQSQRSMNGKAGCSPLNLSDNGLGVRSPNFDDSSSGVFQMRRTNSEWNLSNALISEPGVTTPHPTSSKCRRRFVYQSNGAPGRCPRNDSSSSGFHSGESCDPPMDLDATDPSLNVEVTLMGISPDGEPDEQPKGDAQAPQFKMPQTSGQNRKINDRHQRGNRGPARQ